MGIWKRFLEILLRRKSSPPTSYALLLIGMSKVSGIIEEYSDSVGEAYPIGQGTIKVFTQSQVEKALNNPYAAFVVHKQLQIEAKTMQVLNENNNLSEEILKQTAKNDEILMQIRSEKEKS